MNNEKLICEDFINSKYEVCNKLLCVKDHSCDRVEYLDAIDGKRLTEYLKELLNRIEKLESKSMGDL